MKKIISFVALVLIIASCKKNLPSDPIVPPIVPPIETITIGSQTWIKKNLDVTKYRNGDIIPHVANKTIWANTSTGAWCYYNNDSTTYAAIYGKLYNWYAVNDARGLSPAGYHIPTDAEWSTLSTFLGGDSVAGSKMKEEGTIHWVSPNTGATNSSGFTGLPGGVCGYQDDFYNIGINGFWWSSTLEIYNTWYVMLYNDDVKILRNSIGPNVGFSVRCIKD